MLPRLGFVSLEDLKFKSTLAQIENRLKIKNYIKVQETDSTVHMGASLEYYGILCDSGRKNEARENFQHLLDSAKNSFGMLSETFDVETNESWGNFPNVKSEIYSYF